MPGVRFGTSVPNSWVRRNPSMVCSHSRNHVCDVPFVEMIGSCRSGSAYEGKKLHTVGQVTRETQCADPWPSSYAIHPVLIDCGSPRRGFPLISADTRAETREEKKGNWALITDSLVRSFSLLNSPLG
jgi:hypothetical protein